MSLLHELLREIAAAGSISAHAIAGTGGHEGVADLKKKKKKRKKVRKRVISELAADDQPFDSADIISKLKQAEKEGKHDEDTVGFALEDEYGNIVKVYVRAEQASDFEQALEDALGGNDGDEDEENSSIEIAEVLYNLRDKFDIIDVDWPEIPEDEEEEQTIEGKDDMGGEGEGTEGEGTEGEGTEGEGTEGEDMDMTAEEPDVGSTLTQVIDMMKADAEARKAQAQAEKEKAKAEAAEAAAQSAQAKVKQEEEILDMEAYNAQKKKEDEEAKRLAQLAKYKHDLATDKTQNDSVEDEEEVNDERIMDPKEFAELVIKHLQAQ